MIAYLFQPIGTLVHRGVLGAAIVLAALSLGACGYRMEGQYLPDNLSTISIGAIHNRTFTGELDVRLKHELRRKLTRNPNLRLVPENQGELTLEVQLNNASFSRHLDVSRTDLNSILMSLSGHVTLRRTDAQPRIVRSQDISVSTALGFDQAVIETPAVRDEITNDAIVLFVERVESMIYASF